MKLCEEDDLWESQMITVLSLLIDKKNNEIFASVKTVGTIKSTANK